ncbi:DUF3658 domain-containing protein [Paenibacillus solisilvae]|uniref:DUF3658 domain-containing protein n=1 Tax=Paenibacillus solisilvae TaxID=2486751 RepID=A0ABW0VXR2_9BACL
MLEEESEDDFVRAGRVIAKICSNLHQLVGDSFIQYRMWTLISNGVLAFKGLPFALYQYCVRVV